MPATAEDRVEALKRQAKMNCEGCRLSWRLDGWRHREPMPIECTAKMERQQIREIARPNGLPRPSRLPDHTPIA